MKKLYVGNLSFKATEEEVRRCLRKLACNRILSLCFAIVSPGQPRGFGFAEIKDDAEAEKVIAALNGKEFLGRALVVNEARPQREGGRRWRWRGHGGGGGGGGGRGGHGGGGGGGGRWTRRGGDRGGYGRDR